MAFSNLLIPVISLIMLLSTSFLAGVESKSSFARSVSPSSLGHKKEKLTHLHFYLHDILSGKNPTAVRVAEAAITNSSKAFFGAVVVADDPLTEGPDPNSKVVGKAQGTYTYVVQEQIGLLMVFNLGFTEGKYNGSNLSLLGRNQIFNKVRELPIVGGNGVFRFARGYAQVKTHFLDIKTGDAVLEYDVYVYHY